MPGSDRPRGAAGEKVQAEWRLDVATTEQDRLRDAHQAAKGTDREVETSSSLRAADDQVRARARWLSAVDEQHY